jgi:urease accessory protein
MLDVSEVLPRGSFDPRAASDRLVLDHDMRLRRRIVLRTVRGASVRLYEAKPVQLRDGDGLKLANGDIMLVEAAGEALIEITADTLPDLIRIAWHLGNRHLPTQLLGHAIRIREDHVIEAMVEGLGGHCLKVVAPFDPEGGAYAEGGGGHGHHHHDDHDHGHAHDHGHSHAHGHHPHHP